MIRPSSLIVAMLLVAGSLCGCRTNEATGRLQLSTMSREDEISLGQAAMPELVTEYGGVVEAAALRDYVTEIGMKMVPFTEGDRSTLPWEFTVLDSDVINAFALPGGKVFISRGLLEQFENEAQIAGVLGHEIGHVTARHVDERISSAQGLNIGVSILGAVVGAGSNWGSLVGLIVGTTGQGYLLKFGRDQESEADALGVRYMSAAGYDPEGMVQVIEVLKAASDGPRQIEMLATHPHPETRLVRVRKLLGGEYAWTVNNPDLRMGEESFRSRGLPYLPRAGQTALAPGSLPTGCWCGSHHATAQHDDEGARISLNPKLLTRLRGA